MKKTYFKLSLLMVFLSFLWSCQHELLQTGQDYSVQSQNITIRRLSREELQLQHPDVMQKVENLVSKKHSVKGIYTDAENGFSIDTDVAVYIQDRYGNKTYTFEAITDKKDASVLQNIVLKDLGDGTFSVWMANYDQEILSNREQTSTEFLKQHITLNNLGDKKGSDIFGKYLMCFTPIAMYEYIPAIPCTSNEHHTDPSQCDCGTPGHNCTPPTPSNYEFLYYIGTFDCGPGGSGNTTGGDGSTTGGNHGTSGTGGTTLPVGLGAGNGFDPSIFDLDNPCIKIKADMQKAKNLINNATIKNQNNTMKTDIVTDLNEKRFFFGKDANGAYQVSPIETLGTMGGSNSTSVLFTPEGDFHNHNGIEYPPCPSPGDIYGLHDYHASYPTFDIRFVNGADGSLLALTITDPMTFNQFVIDHPLATTVNLYDPTSNPTGDNFWIKNSEIYNDFYKVATYFAEKGYSPNDYYAYGMAYVTKKHNTGTIISQKDSNGDFKPIEIKEKKDPFDPEKRDYEITHPCGL